MPRRNRYLENKLKKFRKQGVRIIPKKTSDNVKKQFTSHIEKTESLAIDSKHDLAQFLLKIQNKSRQNTKDIEEISNNINKNLNVKLMGILKIMRQNANKKSTQNTLSLQNTRNIEKVKKDIEKVKKDIEKVNENHRNLLERLDKVLS